MCPFFILVKRYSAYSLPPLKKNIRLPVGNTEQSEDLQGGFCQGKVGENNLQSAVI